MVAKKGDLACPDADWEKVVFCFMLEYEFFELHNWLGKMRI